MAKNRRTARGGARLVEGRRRLEGASTAARHLRSQTAIETLKQQLDALIANREARIRACAAPEPEDAQCARHLNAFRIEDAKLHNIGPARCAVLRSWGFDTTADVDEAKSRRFPASGRS